MHGEPIQFQETETVLVVESSHQVRTLLSAILEGAHFSVECATTAPEAMQKIEKGRFSAILVEATNPYGQRSLLSDIAGRQPDVLPRVIAVTSVIRTSRFHTELAQMDLFGTLRKPFDVLELLDAVNGCAASARLQLSLPPPRPVGAGRKSTLVRLPFSS